MSKLMSPANLATATFSIALGLLALSQYRAAEAFDDGAIQTTATVIELRTEKAGILDGQANTFAQVEFTLVGATTPVTAELPTAIDALGFDEASAIGSTVPILYNPDQPTSIRHGRGGGRQGALILLGLAVGALFVPSVLKRATLLPKGRD